MHLYVDIETAPLPDERLAELEPEFEASASLRDLEKIAADIAAKRARWRRDAGLSALTGRVIALGWALDDQPATCIMWPEADLLSHLVGLLRGEDYIQATIVGHNIESFDLPFLMRRGWAHGITLPPWLFSQGRVSRRAVCDTMLLWSLGDRENRISLPNLCRHLGIKPPVGDGAEVARQYREGETDAITAHCLDDVRATREVHRRLTEGRA